jgi:hypothetical protein
MSLKHRAGNQPGLMSDRFSLESTTMRPRFFLPDQKHRGQLCPWLAGRIPLSRAGVRAERQYLCSDGRYAEGAPATGLPLPWNGRSNLLGLRFAVVPPVDASPDGRAEHRSDSPRRRGLALERRRTATGCPRPIPGFPQSCECMAPAKPNNPANGKRPHLNG